MAVNKQSLTNEASATASDVFSFSLRFYYCSEREAELNDTREPMMKTLTSMFLLSTCLVAVLYPYNLAAAEAVKQQQNFNSSKQAQPIFKKIRRSATALPSRVSQRIITLRNTKTSLKQAHLIHSVLPYSSSQSE